MTNVYSNLKYVDIRMISNKVLKISSSDTARLDSGASGHVLSDKCMLLQDMILERRHGIILRTAVEDATINVLDVIDIGTLHDVSIVSGVEVTDNIVSFAKLDEVGYTTSCGN